MTGPRADAGSPMLAELGAAVARLRTSGPIVVLLCLLAVGAMFVPTFASASNAGDIVQSQSFVGLVAVGMTFIVLSGSFVDLSVPAVMAISANAALALQPSGLAFALMATLAIALFIGLGNGLITAYLRVNPIITTLGVGALASAMLLYATDAAYSTGTILVFTEVVRSRPLGIPVPTIAFIAAIVVAEIAIRWTRFGSYLRLAGANREAAHASGVPVRRIVIAAFVIMSLASAVAGILLAGFTNQADITTGSHYEFDALIAVVLGGTPLTGGVGSFGRTLIGVLVVGVLNNIMLLIGLDISAQLLVKGGLFILVVALDTLATRKSP